MILLVDDDPRSIRPYADELEQRGFECVLLGSIDEALRLVSRRKEDLEFVVLDMMMPTGKAFANQAHEGGLRSGALLHQTLRAALPEVPMMVFTNRNIQQLDGPFRLDPACECRMKEELLPGELADWLTTKLGDPSRRPRKTAPRQRGQAR